MILQDKYLFFILTVIAAESAIGLAIIVVLFRTKQSINVDIGKQKDIVSYHYLLYFHLY